MLLRSLRSNYIRREDKGKKTLGTFVSLHLKYTCSNTNDGRICRIW